MKKNVLLIIFIVIAVLASAMAVYFGISYNKLSKKENLEETLDLENVAASEENKEEQIKEVEKIVEKVVYKSSILNYDNTKSRNVKETESYSGSIAKFYNDTSREYILLINKDGSANVEIGQTKYPINGIEGKVKDGMIGSYYQGTDISLFLLLEDGTLVSVTGFDMFKQTGFQVKEKIEGAKDIVRLETVINEGGKRLPIAIDSEGYYYSIK